MKRAEQREKIWDNYNNLPSNSKPSHQAGKQHWLSAYL